MDTPRNGRKALKDCESSSDMAAKGKTQNVVSKRQKKNLDCYSSVIPTVLLILILILIVDKIITKTRRKILCYF